MEDSRPSTQELKIPPSHEALVRMNGGLFWKNGGRSAPWGPGAGHELDLHQDLVRVGSSDLAGMMVGRTASMGCNRAGEPAGIHHEVGRYEGPMNDPQAVAGLDVLGHEDPVGAGDGQDRRPCALGGERGREISLQDLDIGDGFSIRSGDHPSDEAEGWLQNDP